MLSITKEGIGDGKKFFPASNVKDLRWGVSITSYYGVELCHYMFAVRNDANETIMASWTSDRAIYTSQMGHFSSIANAAMHYLAPTVIDKFHKRLTAGQTVVIGPCTLTREGIAFQTSGLIFKKNRFIAWRDVATDTRNGQVFFASKVQNRIGIAVCMRDTDNAVLLPVVSDMMEKEQD